MTLNGVEELKHGINQKLSIVGTSALLNEWLYYLLLSDHLNGPSIGLSGTLRRDHRDRTIVYFSFIKRNQQLFISMHG